MNPGPGYTRSEVGGDRLAEYAFVREPAHPLAPRSLRECQFSGRPALPDDLPSWVAFGFLPVARCFSAERWYDVALIATADANRWEPPLLKKTVQGLCEAGALDPHGLRELFGVMGAVGVREAVYTVFGFNPAEFVTW